MFDMHCHLGFFEDPLVAASELISAGHTFMCATVEPAEYERLEKLGFANLEGVRLGVGLHPWWIADGRCGASEIKRALELAEGHRFISEIGLDFSGQRAEQGELQVTTFEALLDACKNGDHVLSIHAVNAAGEVLDLLQKHRSASNNTIIFHWFSGSGYELMRARQMGCYFSVGTRMLETKRGRAYAQQIPKEQLLLETDLPSNRENGEELLPEELLEQLEEAQAILAELKGQDALETIEHTSKQLLGFA